MLLKKKKKESCSRSEEPHFFIAWVLEVVVISLLI